MMQIDLIDFARSAIHEISEEAKVCGVHPSTADNIWKWTRRAYTDAYNGYAHDMNLALSRAKEELSIEKQWVRERDRLMGRNRATPV